MLLADVEIATVAGAGLVLPQALRKEIPNKVSAHAKIFFTNPPKPTHHFDTEFPTYPSRWARD